MRKRAKERKQERFTTLLHHLSIDLLRDSFLALKRKAAPGVDGVTWDEYEQGLEERLVDLNKEDGAAVAMVTRMDALFLVDRNAREQGMSPVERHAFRREHARPGSTEIRQECLSIQRRVLPQSALGKAVSYTLNMWKKLERCFEFEEVELSNNLAENSM